MAFLLIRASDLVSVTQRRSKRTRHMHSESDTKSLFQKSTRVSGLQNCCHAVPESSHISSARLKYTKKQNSKNELKIRIKNVKQF